MLRKGDILIISSLDRLGRRVSSLNKLLEEFVEEGIHLVSLREGFDFSTARGKLLFNLLSTLAEYERQLMLERQAAGIARAKREGKYKGRKRLPLPEQSLFEECYNKFENSTRRRKYSLSDFYEEVNKSYKNKKNGKRGSIEIQISKSTLQRWVNFYRGGKLYPTQKLSEEEKR